MIGQPEGHPAANLQHVAAAVDQWDRQRDGQAPQHYTNPATYYASSVNSERGKENVKNS